MEDDVKLNSTPVSTTTWTTFNSTYYDVNSTMTSHDHHEEEKESTARMVILFLVSFILMAVTVLGNLLVIISYHKNRRLRTINNLFLISLACSDLIIGLVSMNLYPIYMVTKKWFFGVLLCDIWLCIDYTMSMASVANLLLICVDRYLSVTKPFTYRSKRTRNRARIGIVIAWTISFLIWSPAIIIWPRVNSTHQHENHDHDEKCYIAFLVDPVITVITAFVAFYLPVIVMSVLYWRIYLETRRCSQYLEYLKNYSRKNSRSAKSSRKYSQTSTSIAFKSANRKKTVKLARDLIKRNAEATLLPNDQQNNSNQHISSEKDLNDKCRHNSAENGFQNKSRNRRSDSTSFVRNNNTGYRSRAMSEATCVNAKLYQPTPAITVEYLPEEPIEETIPQQAKVPSCEKKAARTLSAILVAFIITWLPYNICVVIGGFRGPESIPTAVWDASYYICYINSTVNPFCFALCNKTFRQTFIDILTCRKSSQPKGKCRCLPFKRYQKGERHSDRYGLQPSTSSSRSTPPSPSFSTKPQSSIS